MSQTPTPEALAAARKLLNSFRPMAMLGFLESTALAFDAHTADLQATIARLTRELGEARDAEAAEIAAWLKAQWDGLNPND